MIDQATIDRILDRAEILDVVSDFVTLHRSGQGYVGLCPFHQDRRPSFHVNSSKNICKCFSCGEGGSPLNFIMKHEKLSYVEALRYLAKKYGITIVERELSPEEQQKRNDREALLNINDAVAKIFADALLQGAEGRRIGLSYFKERQINDEMIALFQLGYSPASPTFLSNAALDAGLGLAKLEELGLIIKRDNGSYSDRFRERVIFPIHSISGNVVGFGGRIMKQSDKLAKYQNSPESLIYNKRRELYGLYQAKSSISKEDRCLIVEGYMDVLSFYQVGITNVVASSGTALTIEQVRLIKRFTNRVTLIFDSDAAGIKAALRGIDLLLEQDMQVQIVLLPDGHDPDSYSKSHSIEEIREYIDQHQQDFIRFKIDRLNHETHNDPHAQAEVINSVVESISFINDPIVTELYVKDAAQLLGVSEDNIYLKVQEYRGKRAEEARREKERNDRQEASLLSSSTSPNESSSLSPVSGSVEPLSSSDKSTAEPLDTWSSKLYSCESNLVRYIIRYGDLEILSDSDDETTMPLIHVIYGELSDLESEGGISPLFSKFLSESLDYFNSHPSNPNLLRYLTSSPIDSIRELANALSIDSFQLSRLHQKFETEFETPENLMKCALIDILSLKFSFVEKKIKNELLVIKELTESGHPDELLSHISILQELNEQKKMIAHYLGDRIITPSIKVQ